MTCCCCPLLQSKQTYLGKTKIVKAKNLLTLSTFIGSDFLRKIEDNLTIFLSWKKKIIDHDKLSQLLSMNILLASHY